MTTKIDYLTMTWRSMDPADDTKRFGFTEAAHRLRLVMAKLAPSIVVEYEAAKPAPFYTVAVKERNTGVVLHLSERLHSQGVKLVMSGKALANIHIGDVFVGFLTGGGWNVTRADFAVDLMLDPRHLHSLMDYHNAVPVDERKRKIATIGSKNGATLYVGSRRSTKMLRVYDKGAESGGRVNWVRFEMEYKKEAAMNAVQAWAKDRSAPISDMLKFANMPHNALCVALDALRDGEETIASTNGKHPADRNEWFWTTVAASWRNFIEDDPYEAAKWLEAQALFYEDKVGMTAGEMIMWP